MTDAITLGTRVVDRDAPDNDRREAVVVALHDIPADRYPIDSFGMTVADTNPDYAPDRPIATVAFVTDLEIHASGWQSIPIDVLSERLLPTNVDLYTYPVDRLDRTGGARYE